MLDWAENNIKDLVHGMSIEEKILVIKTIIEENADTGNICHKCDSYKTNACTSGCIFRKKILSETIFNNK